MAVPLVSQTARHPLGLSRAPSGSQCALEVAHDTIPELDPPQGPARMRGGGHPACPCAQQPSLPLGTGSVSSPSGPQSHHLSAPGVSGIFGVKEALSPCHPRGSHVSPQFLGSCLTLGPGSAPGSGVASPGEAASWSTRRHRLPHGERAGLHVEIHL